MYEIWFGNRQILVIHVLACKHLMSRVWIDIGYLYLNLYGFYIVRVQANIGRLYDMRNREISKKGYMTAIYYIITLKNTSRLE